MSLDDLIKKDKQNRKAGARGGRGGKFGRFGGAPRGGFQGGNMVPRDRQRGAGIFKRGPQQGFAGRPGGRRGARFAGRLGDG